MGVPTSEVGYTPAIPRTEDHEVHKGRLVALGGGELFYFYGNRINCTILYIWDNIFLIFNNNNNNNNIY